MKPTIPGGLGFLLLLLLAACSTQEGPAPSGARGPAPATALAWQDFTLYFTTPEALGPSQKQSAQQFAQALPAFLAGVRYEQGGLGRSLETKAKLELRGLLMRESWRRDGLAIWKFEGQIGLPPAARRLPVSRIQSVELATDDSELAANAAPYPANRLLVVLANRALRQAGDAAQATGLIRLALLQYDSALGRFRAKWELIPE